MGRDNYGGYGAPPPFVNGSIPNIHYPHPHSPQDYMPPGPAMYQPHASYGPSSSAYPYPSSGYPQLYGHVNPNAAFRGGHQPYGYPDYQTRPPYTHQPPFDSHYPYPIQTQGLGPVAQIGSLGSGSPNPSVSSSGGPGKIPPTGPKGWKTRELERRIEEMKRKEEMKKGGGDADEEEDEEEDIKESGEEDEKDMEASEGSDENSSSNEEPPPPRKSKSKSRSKSRQKTPPRNSTNTDDQDLSTTPKSAPLSSVPREESVAPTRKSSPRLSTKDLSAAPSKPSPHSEIDAKLDDVISRLEKEVEAEEEAMSIRSSSRGRGTQFPSYFVI